ncbi:MAG: 3-isopropylmalate dehydrogenase [Oscillospiraceae bacterium]|jgi:3-isopropylmalate dehydrogenase
MNYTIAKIPGDGIGPEIIAAASEVLAAVGAAFGHRFSYVEVSMGGVAIDRVGKPYPDGTTEICRKADAVLLGAVGGPKWDEVPADLRPEKALLTLRKELGLFANLRPAALRPALRDASPLKPGITEQGIDLLIVRELTGGVYFGKRERYQTADRGEEATDLMAYSEMEIERIGRKAFELARLRRKKLVSVDKANVLETSRLWRSVMHRLAAEYSDISYSDMLVDNCAMQLMRAPSQFDVLVTENMFGDILSDEAGMLTGSLGLLPSASIGAGGPGVYEPSHGSAPDMAGKDIANPLATILSVSMLLRYSLGLNDAGDAVDRAVDAVLAQGYRTQDMANGGPFIGTKEMGRLVAAHVAK